MKGVILLPSLNRPEMLKQFLKSYEQTNATADLMILVDAEDYKKNEAEYSPLPIINTDTAVSMGDKVRYVWDRLAEYNWVGLLNDDHYCITNEWDKRAEELLEKHDMISTNDGYWNFGSRVVGLTAWRMAFLRDLNLPIFPRKLQHLYIDDFWKAVGESTGCWHETAKINIEHRHVFTRAMQPDETFKKVYSDTSSSYDQKEFQHVMEQDFKDLCLKIMAQKADQKTKQAFL